MRSAIPVREISSSGVTRSTRSTALSSLPEIAPEYVGRVKLCYIDPPFNTGQTFQHYDDALEHSVWLTMLRDRLVQIKKLLSPDGSVWVHLDDVEVHRARSVMDEIFGPECYVTTVVWQKADSPRMDAKQFSSSNDFLLVYSRTSGWQPKKFEQTDEEEEDDSTSGYPYIDEDDGRRFKSAPLRKWGTNSARRDRPNLWYPITAPTGEVVWPLKPDATEGNWRWGREKVAAEPHRIQWIDKGSGLQPYVKTFEDEDRKPRPPETWWTNAEVGHNREAKAHIKQLFGRNNTFATPKPERLLQRIIFLSSDKGDLVLDCFLGSGTTSAVAHKMGRTWVGVELSEVNVDTFIRPRLEKVVAGEDQGGITEVNEWKGGGGFVVAKVAPSMFEELDGTIVLAEWATGGELAKAVCAQVRYAYELDLPFAGHKGRSRLAVIDGMLTTGVVDFLVGHLEDNETLLAYAQALEPGIEEYIRAARSGSRARKVPRDLARSGVLASRLVRLGEAVTS